MSMQSLREANTRTRVRREMMRSLPLFEEDPASLHTHQDYAWIEPFDLDERAQLRRDVAHALMLALSTGDWSEYDEALDGWQETAHVLQDEQLTVALLEERDPNREVRLRRP